MSPVVASSSPTIHEKQQHSVAARPGAAEVFDERFTQSAARPIHITAPVTNSFGIHGGPVTDDSSTEKNRIIDLSSNHSPVALARFVLDEASTGAQPARDPNAHADHRSTAPVTPSTSRDTLSQLFTPSGTSDTLYHEPIAARTRWTKRVSRADGGEPAKRPCIRVEVMLGHNNSLGIPSDPAPSESGTWSKKEWLEHYIALYPRSVGIFVALLYQQNRGLVSFDAAQVIIVILSYSDLRVKPDHWQDHSFWKRTRTALGKIEVWMGKALHWASAFDRRDRMPWFPCSTDAQALRYLDPYGGLLVPRSVCKLLHGVQFCWMIFGRPPTEFWSSARLDDPDWRREYMLPVARDFEQRVTRSEAARVEALMKEVFPTKPKGLPKVGFKKFDYMYRGAPSLSPDGRRYARPDFEAPPDRLADPEVCKCTPVFAEDVDRLPVSRTSDNDNDTTPSRGSSPARKRPACFSTAPDDKPHIGRRSAALGQDHAAGGNHSQLSEVGTATERTPPASRPHTPLHSTASPGGGYRAVEEQNAELWEAHQKTATHATEMSKAWALVMKSVCDMQQNTERDHQTLQALSSRVDGNHESVERRLSEQDICIAKQAAQLAEQDNRLAQQETRLAEQAYEIAQLKTLTESLPRVAGGRDPVRRRAACAGCGPGPLVDNHEGRSYDREGCMRRA